MHASAAPSQVWAGDLLRLVLYCSLAMVAGACAGPDPTPDSGTPFPEAITQSQALDVQVIRDVTHIRLTNTSARSFGPSTLWINAWYSLPIQGFDVSQTLDLDLRTFTDRHGEAFRAGGFFAAERPDKIVLVQIQEGDELVGLTVVGGGEE